MPRHKTGFTDQVDLARTYLIDGAGLSSARVLRDLADKIEKQHNDKMAAWKADAIKRTDSKLESVDPK